MALRHVFQATRTDCGPATVAMVARTSVRQVHAVAVNECGYPEGGPYYTEPAQLRRLLACFGIRGSRLCRFRSWDRLPDIAILLLQRHPENLTGHWVVFERPKRGPPRVLDPWWGRDSHIRTQLGRVRVTYYVVLTFPEAEPPRRKSKRRTS